MFLAALLALPLLGAASPPAVIEPRPTHPWANVCVDWDEWDKPGPAFRVYGNTYYIGTCGIASILIISDEGHVLIDSGTETGAEIVLANIRSLGFDPRDVKLLLNSHEHFDHVGGMAKLQEETGAEIVTSLVGAQVMLSGEAHPEDPQFGMHDPMSRVESALVHSNSKAQSLLDRFNISPIPTPGHTPGAMSWTWRSCEAGECRTVVYADSLSAVSSDDYRFVDHADYLRDYFASLQRVGDARCDILLTPHPSASQMRGHLQGGGLYEKWAHDCNGYMQQQREGLLARLAKEDPNFDARLLQQGAVE